LAVVVPDREILERESIVVVVVSPFTIDVRRLVEVEYERVLVFTAVVVDTTPFTLEVIVLPDEEIELFEITLVVAITPFTLVVKVLPVTDWVKELMILDTLDDIPFTMVWKRFAEEEETLVLITVVVDTLSFTLEVNTFALLEIVFDIGIEEVGIVREALVRFRFPVITVLPERVEDPDIKLLVFVVEAVIFVAKRFVK
jgi:phage-related holin